MITIEEFKDKTKHQMVVTIIETMVMQGWDISKFILNFRSYKVAELIKKYEMHLDYAKKQN